MRYFLIVIIVLSIVVALLVLPKRKAIAQATTRELILLYNFTETSGNVIHDRSTVEPRLDLTIPDTSKVEWLNPGLRINSAMVALTAAARTKLDPTLFFTHGITIEAWLKPLNNTQSGPARIVTFSQDSALRNFTLGQEADKYNQRFRTDQTNTNGSDKALSSLADTIQAAPSLQHVIFCRDSAGKSAIYIDRVKVVEGEIPGANNWNTALEFGLFNETSFPTDTRTWLGEIYSVAIYRTILTAMEINDNFRAGPHRDAPDPPQGLGTVTLAWDANTESDLAGYKIYFGTASGSYEWSIEVGNVTEYTLTGLVEGVAYYMAATAYDTDSNESAFSEELVHTCAFTKPGEGQGLTYKDVKRWFRW
jgi:hypothetical protein